MTTETERIKKLIKNHWDGNMWHGNNLSEVLKGITWQQAFHKPGGFKHNIYEYVHHMHNWRKFVVEHINGNSSYSIEINSPSDWPTNYEASEASWNKILADLQAAQEQLLLGLDTIKDKQLNDMVPGQKYRWYVFLHGVVHHDIYHSAQVSLLKNYNA